MRFGILGPLTVGDGGRSVEITAPKQRALLILLLLEAGRVVPAEVILDRLWPDKLPSGGLKTVRFHVSKLRSALEPEVKGSGFKVLETRDAGYLIDPERHEIDSRVFDRLANEGHREMESRPDRAQRLLSDALGLWRGRALHDVAYEEFAAAEARRLEARKLTATEDRIACELRLGRTGGVVAELEELAAENPLRERATELLMQALYAAGRSAEAIAAAQSLRSNLGELGLEPPPSLVQLESQILVHDESLAAPTAPDPPQTQALPGRLTSFIGRHAEVRYVEDATRRWRLVTLAGPPGSGKTRLALEAGRMVAGTLRDGAAWVELGDIASGALVPQAFSAALGLEAPIGADYADIVVSHLRPQQALVIVDNCEHVLTDAASLILSILQSCPEVRILATSREALGVPGEHGWTVPPLEAPAAGEATVGIAAEMDSIRLFVDRAEEADSRFRLTEGNVGDVAAICRRLDGLPLAIELAASATQALPVHQIVTRLDRRFVEMPGSTRHGMSRQATMEQAVRWSYDLLDAAERTVFARLSVFAGGFSMEAAEAVAGWGRVDRDDVFDAVLHLVHKSLLVPSRTADDRVRYRMLMVLRQFGQRELQAEGESGPIDIRHAEYYTNVAESIAPHLQGPTASRGREIADTELDNFRTAMESSIGNGRIDLATRIDAALTWHWYWRSYIEEGRRWGTRILAAAPDADPSPARAEVLYAVGIFETITGQYADGHDSFAQAGKMAGGLGLQALQARSLTGRGVNARDRGRLSAALDYLDQAEHIDRQTEDVGHLALTLRFVGVVKFMLGDLSGAEAALDETFELFTDLGHKGGMGWAREGQARVAFRRGTGDGFDLAAEAAELYAAVKDRRNHAWLLIRTALARLHDGAHTLATADLVESLALFTDLNDRRGIAYAQQHLAMVALAERDHARAAAKLRIGVEMFERIGEEGGLASSSGWLATLAVLGEDAAAAASHCRGWLALPPEDRYAWSVLDILEALGAALDETGGPAQPVIEIRRALREALERGVGVREAVAAIDSLPQHLAG